MSESLIEELSEANLSQSFKKIFKDFDCTFVRYLQFRLLHGGIITNELLYRMEIVDNPECNNTPTTIEFAFLECHKIHSLWRQLEFWLGIILRDKSTSRISDSETTLVTAYENYIIDTENLLTKKNTYKNRQVYGD